MGLDPQKFAKLPALRQEYITQVVSLKYKVSQMRQAGMTSEQIARALSAERRAIGVKYKDLTPQDYLENVIFPRNIKMYGDKWGPTIDYHLKKGRTWEQIIEKSYTPGGADLGLGAGG